MTPNPTTNLNNNDLSDIRDAVPALDLLAIRSLRRAGFHIVKQDGTDEMDIQAQARTPERERSRSSNSAA